MPTSEPKCTPPPAPSGAASNEATSTALPGADRLKAVCGAQGTALRGWAASLTSDLGLRPNGEPTEATAYEWTMRAHADWARSGAMWLTGRADGPPVLAPAAFASAAAGAVEALAALCTEARGRKALRSLDAASLLGERAAALGLSRSGATSAGGHCRILPTRDGALALQLARDEDISLLEAWLEAPRSGETPWSFAAREVAPRACAPLVERARMMGLACADANESPPPNSAWLGVHSVQPPAPPPTRPPLVVDLSSLWAGPLAGDLLQLAGAEVIKVEATRRPDGARRGPAWFFDAVNAGKRSVALDFATPDGVRALERLVAAADIVIEASRPRALSQLGIDARDVVAAAPGKTWISITGYGRERPFGDWIAFGDDAGVAAGASAALHRQEGEWLFCGDALADPLTGTHAALAALASYAAGGSNLLDVSLRGVTAMILDRSASLPAAVVRPTSGDGFEVIFEDGGEGLKAAPVERPRLRQQTARAAELGADTAAVLESLA